MNSGIIGKIIYFWAFIIGVIIFGKIFGFMKDDRTTIIILIASAVVYIVWVVGRSKAKQRKEEKEWQAQQERIASRKAKGKRR